MEWKDARRSDNVHDLRGRRFGGGGGLRVGGMGLGGLVVLLLLTYLLGGDPLTLLTQGGAGEVTPQPSQDGSAPVPPEDDEMGQFMRAVLASTEDVWAAVFQQQLSRRYQNPRLNLFSDRVASACGTASAAVGPFYCPGDGDIYIDLAFYRELDRRFGAPGDFAQAYVIAHEVGHHVQHLLGLNERVRRMQQQASEVQANQLSVRLELQADCFAGLWGHYVARQSGPNQVRLNEGDIDEGLRAAAAIGDDTIQRRSQGDVSPETWTHGSSDQRARWLRRGLQDGLVASCHTFEGS